MQNVKTAARRAGLGIAVAGIAAVATVAPASAYAPTVSGTQPASSAGFDSSAASASSWNYSWSTDASGATTYTYGDGATATSSAPASSVGAAAPAPQATPAPEAAPAEQGLSTQSVGSASSEAPASTNGITSTAMSYVGTPYVWGGTSTSGWDCSGFVQHVYAQHGIELPRLASAQGAAGTPTSNPQPGDLVVQNGGAHIGIYLGNGQMISALNPGQGTQVHSVDSMPVDYYASF